MLFEKHGLRPWQAKHIVDSIFKGFIETLKSGGHVEIRGFGSFRVKNYKGYTGMNPQTGQKMQVKPKKVAFFKPGKKLKDRMNSQEEVKAHRSASKGGNQ